MRLMIQNIHERMLPAPAGEAGALIDGLASDNDRLWPGDCWIPMRFDGPLAVGASGGHGFVRYNVTAYEPGLSVTFTFEPGVGLSGTHRFEVGPVSEGRSVLRHTIEASTYGWMRLGWPAAVRWLHDALLEEALDNAEEALTGTVGEPHRRTPWVRLLLATERIFSSSSSGDA